MSFNEARKRDPQLAMTGLRNRFLQFGNAIAHGDAGIVAAIQHGIQVISTDIGPRTRKAGHETGPFFVVPDHGFDGMTCLDACIFQSLKRLEGAEHAQAAVKLAPEGLRVRV